MKTPTLKKTAVCGLGIVSLSFFNQTTQAFAQAPELKGVLSKSVSELKTTTHFQQVVKKKKKKSKKKKLVTAGTASAAAAATGAKVAGSGTSGTFLGPLASTAYGPVQVKVVVTNGKISNVSTPTYPVGTYRDQQINSQAIPMLQQEVIAAQSSNINGISGASYTSRGFYNSLVSALSQAGMK